MEDESLLGKAAALGEAISFEDGVARAVELIQLKLKGRL
jgi:hypothetical protein